MKTLNIPPEVKKKFSSIFGSKPALIIYSIILGASLWLLISLKKYPNTVKTAYENGHSLLQKMSVFYNFDFYFTVCFTLFL